MIKRKLGVAALLAILALAIVGAGSAYAAATTTAAKVFTGPSPGTELTGSKAATLSLESGATFKSELGGPPAQVLEMSATGAECLSCTLENKEVTSKAGKVAFGTGKVKFTGVTVTKPAGCQAEEEAGGAGHITSKQLNGHGDFMNGENAVAQAIPTAGAGASFANFRLENKPGETCSVAGLYSLKGITYITWKVTGLFSTTHSGSVSPAIDTANGGGLTIGTKAASVTGTGIVSLGGTEFTIK
jgi:hypothetical protein